MAYSGSASGSLFAEGGAGTLRLLLYLTACLILMVADHRGGYLEKVRGVAGLLAGPVYLVASSPARLAQGLRENFGSRSQLAADNQALREQLLVSNARVNRLEAVQLENQRLRGLLQGTRGLQLSVQLASLVDIDLDPFRHRIVIDTGTKGGVTTGLAVIDGSGVVGQVVDTTPLNATVMLISDASHAVPVQIVRSGLRTIAYGTGRIDKLLLPNIPLSADVRIGDQLITSGLGGTFPAGFPVGTIETLNPDATRLFVVAEARPSAALDRSGEVLLVRDAAGAVALAEESGPPDTLMSLPRVDPAAVAPDADAPRGEAHP
jgi:rod shape-determining protein MreC